MEKENRDPLTERIIACCFRVHNELVPGFLERIYHNALKIALREEGLSFYSEKEFEVFFSNKKIGKFRCDLIVDHKVIVELKSISGNVPPIFMYKVLSYLKASKIKTGLLINFGNKSCQVKRFSV